MKKLLALVLALVMVLGLGVTAFAEGLAGIHLIVLEEEDDDEDEKEEVNSLRPFIATDEDNVYLVGPEGGDFYFNYTSLNGEEELEKVSVSATGNVTAELVKFDPKTMEWPDTEFAIKDTQESTDDTPVYEGDTFEYTEYDDAKDACDELNKAELVKRNRYKVVVLDEDGNELDTDLLKVTIAENYTAAYKEGKIKLTANVKRHKNETRIAEINFISDVNIFEYEEVKWAAENGEALVIGDPGYSDYITGKLGYTVLGDGTIKEVEYVIDDLRYVPATVVSTTAFKVAYGDELQVASDDAEEPTILVTIDEVAKGQKGVNFALDYEDLGEGHDADEGYFFLYDEDDEEAEKNDVAYIDFGFLGNQVINSDFTIEVDLPWTAYQLRELFGKKVEEEDVITYYVLKDGVKIDEFEVDYANDEIDEIVELEILGKAGDKLGYYTITLDAPAAEEGEKNPNTGAESVVGVVAAMAVISLVSAAAVSLKK